jgi:DNA-binding PadR family transcriptional regulator
MEQRRWIRGRWVEKPGQRRRRYYQITAEGGRVLAAQRDTWAKFAGAINRVARVTYA